MSPSASRISLFSPTHLALVLDVRFGVLSPISSFGCSCARNVFDLPSACSRPPHRDNRRASGDLIFSFVMVAATTAESPSLWTGLLGLLRRGFFFSHLVLHLLWLHLHLRLFTHLVHRRWYGLNAGAATFGETGGETSRHAESRQRKIVFLGDDFTLGVGDWITLGSCPGVHRRCEKALEKRLRRVQLRAGAEWRCTVAARSGASTSTWLPLASEEEETVTPVDSKAKQKAVAEAAASMLRAPKAGNAGRTHLAHHFDPIDGIDRDADIVCVSLGLNDGVSTAQTGRNMARILRRLTIVPEGRPPRIVLVATTYMPAAVRGLLNAATHNRNRNTAIREAVASVAAEHPSVMLGPDLLDVGRPDEWRFKGKFPTGKGYTHTCDMWVEILTPLCVRIEADAVVAQQKARKS